MYDTQSLRFIVGGQSGGRLVTPEDGIVEGDWYALVVNEDAVIYLLQIDDSIVEFANRGLVNRTIRSGMYLFAGIRTDNGVSVPKQFRSIQLTSGSVIMY